jgi:prepilin-type N-terminal cleavage/methylation domain-containing protein
MKKKIDSLGLTLIELLVAISISVIILSILTFTFITGFQSFETEFIKSNLQTETRTVMDRISDDIKLAASVKDTVIDPQTSQQYISGSNTLILQVLAIDSNNNILYDKYDYFVYIFDTTARKITKKTLPNISSARTLKTQTFLEGKLTDSSSFNYAPYSPPSPNILEITVDLTVSQTTRDKTYSNHTNQTTKLRNK